MIGDNKEAQNQNSFKDSLSFADLENQSLVELIELDCFRSFQEQPLSQETLSKELNSDTKDTKTLDQKVEDEFFIPYFTKNYSVIFGSPNYFAFLRCFYAM